VARRAPIAVTSGNSLTVAATLEAAKEAAKRLGLDDLAHGRAMVIGATGSIGSAVSRLLALALRDVVLVSIEPDRLLELAGRIAREAPGTRVATATTADEAAPDCDLIVTATSAFGQRVLDLSRCKPGAIVCDVARPTDVPHDEAALRPDVLVIESGEIRLPGDARIPYDIGLPENTAYACLAETALLAMEGRFESFTLGRDLSVERIKEIHRLADRHGFRLAPLRSCGRILGDADFAERRALVAALRGDPGRFERVRGEAARRIAGLPPRAKNVAAKVRAVSS
jgi:predicted amino acid dehydrogenase